LRIIGGKYKGVPFHPPKSIKARPTTDRAKEALLNTLSNSYEIDGLKVLDLFSGTGNIAYEFASRNASEITCVDISRHSIQFIQDMFKKLEFEDFKTIKMPVLKYLKKCKGSFDIIFADPPYALSGIPEIADIVFERSLLNEGGTLVIEHFKTLNISHKSYTGRREYGQSVFSYFKN
jgi:16S rRNA (guanine966-N2)-methyltransferase